MSARGSVAAATPPRARPRRRAGAVRDQDRLRARVMLGLRQQIGGDPAGIAAVVGDHQHLGGTGDHVDADLAEHQPLGGGDIGVAGADDLGDRRDRRRAVGQRRHRLRAADAIDFGDAAEMRRRQHQRIELAVRRRHHHHHARHARDLGRHRVHQHRGRIGRGAAGHIEPDRLDRAPAPAEFDAERIGEALVLRQLPPVKRLDPVAGEFQRIERCGVAGLHRGIDLGRGHAQAGRRRARAGRISSSPRSARRRRARPRHRRWRAWPRSTSAETSRLAARNVANRSSKSALLSVEANGHGGFLGTGRRPTAQWRGGQWPSTLGRASLRRWTGCRPRRAALDPESELHPMRRAHLRFDAVASPRNDLACSRLRLQIGAMREIAGPEIVGAEVGQLAFQAFDVQPQRPAMAEQEHARCRRGPRRDGIRSRPAPASPPAPPDRCCATCRPAPGRSAAPRSGGAGRFRPTASAPSPAGSCRPPAAFRPAARRCRRPARGRPAHARKSRRDRRHRARSV